MKKIIYTFLFLNILGFSLFGFSYGMDCSVYDDLISKIEAQINNLKIRAQRESNGHFTEEQVGQVLGTSKYANEYNSLKAQYDKAVQDKANCLVNENTDTISSSNLSNQTYTDKSSRNDGDSDNIINPFSDSISNGFDAYDSKNYDLALENFLQALNICENYPGYNNKIDNMCEKIPKVISTIKNIQGNSGIKSEESTNENIECKDGYILNETQTKCVKDTITQRALNCKAWYGEKAVISEAKEDECNCSDGYIRNEDNTQCVKDTKEQREKNCKSRSPISFLGDDGETCECPEGYVADSDNPNYCLIDLSQKSLQSRIMNTENAKCDDTAIILACALEPTGNDCPAVCLELYDAINWMYDNELTIYNDPTKFGIYNPITREQASKFFVNFYVIAFDKKDKIIAIPTPSPFNDIKNADKTLYNFILKSFTLKLFKGTNGKFMPFNHLTKAQALAVMIRMASGILDESQQPRYSNYLYKAESMKLLDNINYSYTTLDNEDIVRGDVALILYRLYEYLENN